MVLAALGVKALPYHVREYPEQMLDTLSDDQHPHAQSNIDLIHAHLLHPSKKWASQKRKAK